MYIWNRIDNIRSRVYGSWRTELQLQLCFLRHPRFQILLEPCHVTWQAPEWQMENFDDILYFKCKRRTKYSVEIRNWKRITCLTRVNNIQVIAQSKPNFCLCWKTLSSFRQHRRRPNYVLITCIWDKILMKSHFCINCSSELTGNHFFKWRKNQKCFFSS